MVKDVYAAWHGTWRATSNSIEAVTPKDSEWLTLPDVPSCRLEQ